MINRKLFITINKLPCLIIFFLNLTLTGILANSISEFDNYKAEEYLSKIPESSIAFTENKGQFVNDKGDAISNVLFKTSFHGVDMYITTKGITYVFLKYKARENPANELTKPNENGISRESVKEREIEWCRLDMEILGSTILKQNILTEQPSNQGVANYYLAHCPDGILNVKSYQKITLKSIYPGIDWIIYADEDKGLKYDFIVHPGADPNNIKLLYKGAKNISTNNKTLNIKTPFGSIQEGELKCYEQTTGKHINSQYFLQDSTIRFKLDNYDKTKTLVIDPPLELEVVWSTYYGGNGFDVTQSATTDNNGNVYITGRTGSANFPTLNPGGGTYFQGTFMGNLDVFIIKFNNAGLRIWATYYGGSNEDIGYSIATDQSGNVFITGSTNSTDFPTHNPGGGVYYQSTNAGSEDIVILKFGSSGIRFWATYYGGSGYEIGRSIATNLTGDIFITGKRASGFNFPYMDPGGGAYFQNIPGGGDDVIILRFNNLGVLIWATLYGGNGHDEGKCITTDLSGNIFITGHTYSGNFPVMNPGSGGFYQSTVSGYNDAFILKFNSAGIRQWATYYGGSQLDNAESIVTDNAGNVFVTGSTGSIDFPTKNPGGGAYYQSANAGVNDVFILKFDSSCNRQWATYYGGNGTENSTPYWYGDRNIIIDKYGNIIICFGTSSTNIPTLQQDNCGYFMNQLTGIEDIFIAEFTPDLNLYWASYFYGSSKEGGRSIIADTNGCVFIMAVLEGSSQIYTYDPGNGAYFQPLNALGYEIGIMKFCPCCPYPISFSNSSDIAVCEGDSASFTVSATSVDSISYQWYHNGIPVIGSTDNICIIDPVSQSDTGFYYCRITNICETKYSDSVRLDLIPTFIDTNYFSICQGDSIFAAGQYQKTTGLYLDSYPCVNYCDSIIFTDLVVNNVYFNQNAIGICNGDSIFIGGKYHSLPGTYYDSLQSINGCDSITVIQLSVNNEIIVQIDTMICYGDSVYAGGHYQTSGGLYVDSLLSVYSCDSIVYTNIDFYPLPVIYLGNDTTINIGDSLILDAGPGCVSWMWCDGSTKQSLTINTPGIYWVQGISICGDVIYDTIIVDVGYSINGTFTYANTAMTGMNNTAIYLKKLPDVIVDSTLTGPAGAYSFGPLANGTYYLEPEITKPWGGGNSTDALAIMKHFVGMMSLNGIYLKAADVDTSGYANTADALMVQRRFVGMISGYFSDDWTWEDNNVIIYGQNINHGFHALCYGDVNGSNIPSQTKISPEITLIPQVEKPIESFQEFDMPFIVEMPLEAGAISLAMEYPSQYLKIKDVKLGNGERDNLVYADKDGEIRISWYSVEPLILETNDTLLLIRFRVDDLTDADNNKLNFTVKSSSELADANATVLNDINLYIPELIINRSPEENFLGQNFPNPFENETEIEYGLKNAGNVNLRVYDILGQELLILVDKYQEAGYYKVKLNKNKLPEGVYVYNISISGNNCSFTKSHTFVISK